MRNPGANAGHLKRLALREKTDADLQKRPHDDFRRAVTIVTKLRAARYVLVTIHHQDAGSEASGSNAAQYQLD